MDSVLAQAFIFLFAAVVCVLISKKLGMGSILGYLLAGILIGPFVLKFIGNDGEGIMHITEFGVVMMLFLVGLSLDPKEFWESRKEILGLGLFQVIGTTVLISVIAYFIFDFSFGTTLTIGFVITMSSTAIILQTISERGLSKTRTGKSSFAVLLFQDVSVIPILAIIPLLAVGGTVSSNPANASDWLENAPVFMRTLAILGAISIIFLVGNYIVNPVFKMVGKLQIKEIYTASALTLVVGVSLLMEQVGLSAALGAFIAGVVLANNPYKQQLESDIEPFKALLLGMFFIAVGSTINFTVIAHKPLLISGILVGSILIKGIVLLAIGRWQKFPKDQSFLFAILLSQIGEFAFVILALGKTTHLLTNEWYDYLIATTALSMVITPILLLLNERWISPALGFKAKVTTKNNYENVAEASAKKKIVIAGFGDFGMTIGRMLQANDIQPLVMDNDSDHVDDLKKLGFKVVFGDATSLNILKTIHIEEAEYVIAALDPASENQRFLEIMKKNFPKVKVIVRAKNRKIAYEYLQEGYDEVYRETFFSAIHLGGLMLESLGFKHEEVVKQSELFIKTDRDSLRKLARNSENFEDYLHLSKVEFNEQTIELKNNLKKLRKEGDSENNSAIINPS
ncbi:MAG: monovalent cation:proton antiporter-2 (CPA2) family protein [Brumimicrobium sp.]|nr:monovalent cation:proton antiporter-2 (CPA2) family protein [Brumimicrobium sp.]